MQTIFVYQRSKMTSNVRCLICRGTAIYIAYGEYVCIDCSYKWSENDGK